MHVKNKVSRILYCSTALSFGGEQKQLGKILSYLNREHFQPVVCSIRPHGYVDQSIQDLADKLLCLGVRNKYNLPGTALRLRKVIREHGIDLIHTGIFGSDFDGLLASLITGVPVVALLTTSYDLGARSASAGKQSATSYWKSRAFYLMHAVLARMTKIDYVAYSQVIKESAITNLHLPAERISVFPIGMDLMKFDGSRLDNDMSSRVKRELGLDGAYPVLLNVARLSSVKGQKDMLQAMPRIIEYFPRARLLIAGDGELLPQLEELRDCLGLNEHVLLLGRRDDIDVLLHLSDMFLLASYYEGLPGAVIEAMAAGKCVVAFNIPALTELIKDGYSGVLIEGRNVGKFSESIISLAEHPDNARNMGERARQIVMKEHDIQQGIRNLEELYEKILIRN